MEDISLHADLGDVSVEITSEPNADLNRGDPKSRIEGGYFVKTNDVDWGIIRAVDCDAIRNGRGKLPPGLCTAIARLRRPAPGAVSPEDWAQLFDVTQLALEFCIIEDEKRVQQYQNVTDGLAGLYNNTSSIEGKQQEFTDALLQIGASRDKDMHLYRELEEQRKEILNLNRKIQLLEEKARGPEIQKVTVVYVAESPPATTADFSVGEYTFEPTENPEVEVTNEGMTVTTLVKFSKTIPLSHIFSTSNVTYVEFKVDSLYSRYLAIGCVRCPLALELERLALGDSNDSWGWYGSDYWMLPLRHAEESSGPKSVKNWSVGDTVGIRIDHHAISFYHNGDCIIPNAFYLPQEITQVKVGVTFGGVLTPNGNTGRVTVAAVRGPSSERALVLEEI